MEIQAGLVTLQVPIPGYSEPKYCLEPGIFGRFVGYSSIFLDVFIFVLENEFCAPIQIEKIGPRVVQNFISLNFSFEVWSTLISAVDTKFLVGPEKAAVK